MSSTSPLKHKEVDHQIKIIMIGNSCVGKTCMTYKYTENIFSPSWITTIGIDFKIKVIDHATSKIKLQIWDTAGQERFRSITASYLKNSNVVILVYDVTDLRSFEAVSEWTECINKQSDKYVQRILVGNKIDMPKHKHVITTEMGQNIARKYKMPFYECSAKTGHGLDEIFEGATTMTLKAYAKELLNNKKNGVINLTRPKPVDSKCRC
jgi:Ras-related protein Rab-8A